MGILKQLWAGLEKRGKFCSWIIVAVLVLACTKGLWDVLWRMSIEMHTTIAGDAFTYMASGRGILNGLTPYEDLLDVKAPGVILLAALSLVVTGNERFVWILQLLVLISVPVIMLVIASRVTRGKDWFIRWVIRACALLVGFGFTIYEAERAGRFQVESFGIFFALLYLLVIVWNRDRLSRRRIVAAALLMVATVGLKEPFLFVLMAMAMLVSRNVIEFCRAFVIPAVVALIAGLSALAMLGYLWPYVTMNLPTIFNDRLAGDHSLFFRGLFVIRVLKDVAWFSPVPMLGYAVFAIWAVQPIFKQSSSEIRSKPWKIASVMSMFLLAYFAHFSVLYWQLVELIEYTFPMGDSFFRYLTIRYVSVLVVCISCLVGLWVRDRRLFWNVVTSIGAAYLVTFAIGSGDFHLSHYLQAIPAYAAVFAVIAEGAIQNRRPVLRNVFWTCVGLCVLIPFVYPKFDYAAKLGEAQANTRDIEQARILASNADRMMDRCGYDRYFDLSFSPVIAFTGHSPMDLGWTTTMATKDDFNPVLRKRFFERLDMSPVVFIDAQQTKIEDTELRAYLEAETTRSIPPCAAGMVFDPRFTPLFKNSMLGPEIDR